jgi:hypothetical protein
MVQVSTPPLTLEEFLQLPETKQAREYIDGKIIPKPMPKGNFCQICNEVLTLCVSPESNGNATSKNQLCHACQKI